MLVNLDEDDWDAVMRVHGRGHFLPLKHAAAHWRAEAKAGRPVAARIVNTTSGAGLSGSVGQGNYAAAKAAIIGLTLVAAAELGRYGVQVNAIAPAARTRMTEETFAGLTALPEDVSPLVVWLGSAAAEGVTGRVFEAEAGRITVMEGWRPGPTADKGLLAAVGGGRRGTETAGGRRDSAARPRRPLTGSQAVLTPSCPRIHPG